MEREDVITYYGPINAQGISQLVEITLEALSQKTNKITLRIDSEGGDLFAAFTAYEHLIMLDVQLETYNLNRLKDDTILLYLAGNKRNSTAEASWVLSEFDQFFGTSSLSRFSSIRKEYVNEITRERFAKIFERRCSDSLNVRDCLACESHHSLFDKKLSVVNVDEAFRAGITTCPPVPLPLIKSVTHWHITPENRPK